MRLRSRIGDGVDALLESAVGQIPRIICSPNVRHPISIIDTARRRSYAWLAWDAGRWHRRLERTRHESSASIAAGSASGTDALFAREGWCPGGARSVRAAG